MRLSTVFELLLIFLFLAFAASRTVGGVKKTVKGVTTQSQSSVQNRYCDCGNLMCNCCRDFALPVVALKGPGCATLSYLNGDAMRLTMTFGDRVLRNITLAGKKPNPVCMPLPGGVSKFCGRVYGITRDGDHFKACLALELRSLEDLEAALRVSCFKFGPDGVKLEPGQPIPPSNTDDDEDDEDDYGFGVDEDEDDDDDDFGLTDDDDEDDDDQEEGSENDVDSGDTDYTGFSALSDEFLDGFFGSSSNKKGTKPTTIKVTETPQKIKKPVNQVLITTAKTPEKKSTIYATQPTTTTLAPQPINKKNKTKKPETNITESNLILVKHKNKSNVTEETPTFSGDLTDFEKDQGKPTETIIEDHTEVVTVKSAGEEDEDEEPEGKDKYNIVKEVEGDSGSEEEEMRSRQAPLTLAETERLFPGLGALIRPPSYFTPQTLNEVRSARTHRRMRLPPIPPSP